MSKEVEIFLIIRVIKEEYNPIVRDIYELLKQHDRGYYKGNYCIVATQDALEALRWLIHLPPQFIYEGYAYTFEDLVEQFVRKYPLTMLCLKK